MTTSEQFLERVRQIDGLVCALEASTDPAAATARELAQAIVELHGTGLARIFGVLGQAGEPGRKILETLVEDDLVRSLLTLHELHPVELETRVRMALDEVLPLVRGYGRELTVLSIEARSIRLRLDGPDEPRSAAALTIRTTVEEAILRTAPEITAVEFTTSETSGALRFALPVISLPTIPA